MIELSRLQLQYELDQKPLDILKIPYLHIARGEQVAITGPSGSGKSTLLHCIGGILEPTSGTISIAGNDITALPHTARDAFRCHYIGYILQDFYLIPSLTAEENIQLVLPKLPKRQMEELLEEWFAKVGLADRRRHLPSQLSRGQQQRVAIIRALIHNPALVLADEPTGSLDYETAKQVMQLLLELCREKHQTLLCVTHDQSHPQLFTRHLHMADINQVLQRGVQPA